jgi:hypothetical protein
MAPEEFDVEEFARYLAELSDAEIVNVGRSVCSSSSRNGIARGVLVDRLQEGKRIASARKAIRRWIVPLNHQEQRSPTIASVPRLRAARETEQHQTNQ